MADPTPTTPPPAPSANDTPVVPRPVMGLSPQQWHALALVIERADGQAVTYVVAGEPNGDAAIKERTAAALERRRLVTIQNDNAWPTARGRRALRLYRLHQARHSTDHPTAEETP